MANNPIDEAKELQQMLVTYAKQETVEPLKTLGGYIGLGLAGAFLMGLSGIFFGLGALRFAQAEINDTNGWWSVLAYLIAVIALVLVLVLLALALNRARKKVLS